MPGYFVGKPVILDLSVVTLSNSATVQLVSEFLAWDLKASIRSSSVLN